MQVFKAFMKLFRKNLGGISIYIVIFMALALGMTMNTKDTETTDFSQTKLTIAVDNKDEGVLGIALVRYFEKNNEIVTVPEDDEKLLDSIYRRELDYVLYIPSNFSELFLKGERTEILDKKDVPSSVYGTLADSQLNQYLITAGMYVDGGFSLEEAIDFTDKEYEKEAEVTFYNEESTKVTEGGYYYFRYIPYILICVMIVGLGPVLMVFRKKEIRDRNNCSATSFFRRNIQIIAGSFVVGLMIFILFAGASFLFYTDSMMTVKGLLSMLNGGVFLLLALCMAYFISQLAKDDNTLNMVSNVLGLGFSFLGGVFVPLDIMGDKVLKVSKFIPTYWYTVTNNKIWDSVQNAAVSKEIAIGMGIQAAFTLALLLIGMVINRMNAKAA